MFVQEKERVLFFVFDIFHDVPYLTVEDPAKHFNGMGADAFVALEPGDLPGADAMLFDQSILGNAFFFHDHP